MQIYIIVFVFLSKKIREYGPEFCIVFLDWFSNGCRAVRGFGTAVCELRKITYFFSFLFPGEDEPVKQGLKDGFGGGWPGREGGLGFLKKICPNPSHPYLCTPK